MTAGREITGLWRGAYFYSAPEMQRPDGSGVGFEMHVTQALWQQFFGGFSGTVHDDPVHGVPGGGVIRGRCSGASVHFTKRLPEFYVGDAKGWMPLRDYLLRHGYELQRIIPHPPILYTGRFGGDGLMTGTWEIRALTLPLDAAGSELPCPRSGGTFTMSRA